MNRSSFIGNNGAGKKHPRNGSPRRGYSRFFFRALESLETRTLLSTLTVAANGKSATYTDFDGDIVTVAISAGTLAGNGSNFITAASGLGDQLQIIDLSAGGVAGANLTVTVKHVAPGDGLANIGYINSTGHDLGNVTIKGDLGRIDAGDATAITAGLKLLSVRSMGRLGLDSQGGTGTLISNINGALTSLVVKGDVKDASIAVTGGANGKIGSLSIGGSLLGGIADNSGQISSSGNMGPVKIGHDLVGGQGASSGLIFSSTTMTSATVSGLVIGGIGDSSGEIFSTGNMGAVKIGMDVIGGLGTGSGQVQSAGTLFSVTLGGSLIGGNGANSGNIASTLAMGAVKIANDLVGGQAANAGVIQSHDTLFSVTIGGSLIGGNGLNTGEIFSVNNMGAVKIGHDILGGAGGSSGLIQSNNGTLLSATLGGSLVGGNGANSGEIVSAGAMGLVKIASSVVGGAGTSSGLIQTNSTLSGVTIGGSLIGGTGSASGELFSGHNMGAVKIGRNITGGSINGSTSLDQSGFIVSGGLITSVSIGGSIITGSDNSSTGTLTKNASISAGDNIGPMTVKGSLIGNPTAVVVISARGQAVQTATDLAISALTIGGRVEFAYILAGYDTTLTAVNGDAQIGAVKVGGDWAASNLVAGVNNLGADDAAGGAGANADNARFGDAHDVSIGAGSAIHAKITSISIGGYVYGTPASFSSSDHYGFVAQQIGSFKAGGISFTLNPLALDNLSLGPTGDINLHEI